MKVVINRCFGGFGLSDAAVEECLRRGMTVTTYNPDGRPLDRKADFQDEGPKCRTGRRYYAPRHYEPAFRSHPVVVAVVEEMGKKADGPYAKLQVVEVPDGVDWEIDEYDGHEEIHEKHRSWC